MQPLNTAGNGAALWKQFAEQTECGTCTLSYEFPTKMYRKIKVKISFWVTTLPISRLWYVISHCSIVD
jgi:hypothetical protein